MSLHRTPEEHDANPPETWEVVKVADRCWHLRQRGHTHGGPLDSFKTRRAAEEARERGWLVNLYAKEGRWFAGEPVTGWKPYVPGCTSCSFPRCRCVKPAVATAAP